MMLWLSTLSKMSFKEEAVKYKYYRKSVTVKTDSAWLRGRDKEADIVVSPLPSTSTSTCANGCLGVVTIFGTAPLAQQSLTAGSGSKCNTGLKISNTNLRLAAVAFCHIQRSPRMADNLSSTKPTKSMHNVPYVARCNNVHKPASVGRADDEQDVDRGTRTVLEETE